MQNQKTNEEEHQNKKNNTGNTKKKWALFIYSHKKPNQSQNFLNSQTNKHVA
jgi:hypothetical protein